MSDDKKTLTDEFNRLYDAYNAAMIKRLETLSDISRYMSSDWFKSYEEYSNLQNEYHMALARQYQTSADFMLFFSKFKNYIQFNDQIPLDTPNACLTCKYFHDPDPYDQNHRQPYMCCFVQHDGEVLPCMDDLPFPD